MSLSAYLVGLLFLTGTAGAACVVAWAFVSRRLGHLRGAPLIVAYSLLALGALLAFHLVPGALGVLSRETVLVTAVLGGAACLLVVRPAPGNVDQPASAPASGRAAWALAGGAICLTSAYFAAAFIRLAPDSPTHIDAVSFALPGVAEWIRSGSLFDTGSFLPLFQIRTYPNNGDLFFLAAILPWRNDAFIRFADAPLIGLLAVAVYAAARELRAPAALAALLACAVISTRVVSFPGFSQLKPDTFMYATFSAGGLFLLRHARTGARSDLVLAGVGLGLAFGSRWYGLSSLAVALIVWVGAFLMCRRRPAAVLRDGAVLVGVAVLAGGFWFVRNAELTGNPVYPIKVEALGLTILDAPRDIITEKTGFSISDYLTNGHVWRHSILPDFEDAFGLPGLLMLIGLAAAAVLALLEMRRGRRSRVLAVVVTAVLLVLAYVVTPGSAQGLPGRPLTGLVGGNARWGVPALLAMAFATAWVFGRVPRARTAIAVALFVAVLGGIHDSFHSDLPGDLHLGNRDVLKGVLGVTLLAGIAAAVVWLGRRGRGAARLAGAAGIVVVGIIAITLGYRHQDRYNNSRYAGLGVTADWLRTRVPDGAHVGFAGGWSPGFVPIYEASGRHFDNEVDFVGPVREGQLQQYRKADDFRSALRRGDYDVLVVGRLKGVDLQRVDLKHVPASARPMTLSIPPEERWAEGVGYRETARDPRFVVMTRSS